MAERVMLSELITAAQQTLARYGDLPLVLVPPAGEACVEAVLVGTVTLADGRRGFVIE